MSDEKTEKATPKKQRESREKGQVASSKDFGSVAVVFFLYLYFFMTFYYWIDRVSKMMLIPAQHYMLSFDIALSNTVNAVVTEFLFICFPVLFLAAVGGALIQFFQIGPIFSFEPIMPKFEKIDPIKGFKRIFCMKNLVEFLKSCAKVIALALTCYYVIKFNLPDILKMPYCKESCVLTVLGTLMTQLLGWVLVVFGCIAVLDLIFQRYQHAKDMRMTKDEVKRDYKEMDGNPEIKGKRKQIHKEIVSGDGAKQAVKKSSVVVTNPTHLAIGLYYVSSEKRLPYITIKGEALLADKIKEIAFEEGIPVMENVDLARLLYGEVDEETFIPTHLLRPVAEVIRWVNEIRVEQGLLPL